MEGEEQQDHAAAAAEGEGEGEGDDGSCCGGGMGWLNKKKRFSEEQIKSLESMFETQTKLEPRQKLQLAKELGLQPRQVAIWFQNKRARWKSKQLEREYAALRSDYDLLLASFDSLKKEKHLLLKHLQKLNGLLDKPQEGRSKCYGDSDNADLNDATDKRPNFQMKEGSDARVVPYSDEEDKKFPCFSEDEAELYTVQQQQQQACSTLTSEVEDQFGFHQTTWPSDQSCTSSQWWEFWP